MSYINDDQPTRVVTIENPEETVILASGTREAPPLDKALFVPLEGDTAEDENTVIWQPERKRPGGPLGLSLRHAVDRPGRRRVLCWCALFLSIGLVVWLIGPKANAGASAERHPSSQTASSVANEPPRPSSEPTPAGPPPTPLIAVEAKGPTLSTAANALLSGRLDEALVLYRTLAERHPQDRSLAMVAEILAAARETVTP